MLNFDRQEILEWLSERIMWLEEGLDTFCVNDFAWVILNGEDLHKAKF